MNIKCLYRVCALGIIWAVLPACSDKSEPDTGKTAGIIAQAGSVTVTTEDLTQALMLMPGAQQFEYLSDKGRQLLLDMLIDWKLLAREALQSGLDKDEAVSALLKTAATAYEREQVLGSAYLRYRFEQLPPVSEEQIQGYYDGHSADFTIPERRKVHRILFVSEERARQALPQLQSGLSFDEYKERYPEEKIKVDTVWLQAAETSGGLQAAVLLLKAGETSDCISTQSGFCIARVLEIVPVKNLGLDEVRERLRAQLQDSNERALIADIRQALRKDLAIDMNTGLLESYECKECEGRAAGPSAGDLQTARPDTAQ